MLILLLISGIYDYTYCTILQIISRCFYFHISNRPTQAQATVSEVKEYNAKLFFVPMFYLILLILLLILLRCFTAGISSKIVFVRL